MIAVGLWGAQLGAPAMWMLPVTFPVVMAFGGFLGLMGVPIPGVELGIALSAVLLGAMVAAEARPPLAVAAVLVGILRDLSRPRPRHRAASRPERAHLQHRIRRRDRLPARVGIAIGLVHRWSAGRVAMRVAGAAIACAGCVFLWRAVS